MMPTGLRRRMLTTKDRQPPIAASILKHTKYNGIGGCARTRTVDPLIKSQLLYHLSYAPGPGGSLAKPIRSVQRRSPTFAK